MAKHQNRVELIGNMGGDPEVSHTGAGKPFVKMSVATTEKWTDDAGEAQEATEWHDVVIWSKQAGEYVQQYARKGDLVRVVGRNKTRKWQDKETGVERKATSVQVTGRGAEFTILYSPSRAREEAA